MPKTIQNFARELADAFETKHRDNGDSFDCLKEDAPEWAQDVVFACHGDMMPNDWRYATIRSAAHDLARMDEDGDPDDLGAEFADQNVDVYNADRLRWLASSFDRVAYTDDAVSEFGYDAERGVLGAIGMGQYAESREVWGLLVDALQKLVDDQEDEADDLESEG